jgi:hypothetical protein
MGEVENRAVGTRKARRDEVVVADDRAGRTNWLCIEAIVIWTTPQSLRLGLYALDAADALARQKLRWWSVLGSVDLPAERAS